MHPKDPHWYCFPQQRNATGSLFRASSGQVPGKFWGGFREGCKWEGWDKVLVIKFRKVAVAERFRGGSKQVPEVPCTVPVRFQIKFSNNGPRWWNQGLILCDQQEEPETTVLMQLAGQACSPSGSPSHVQLGPF